MPLPPPCIECDKPATVKKESSFYCARCYMEVVEDVKPKTNRGNSQTLRRS
jgi:hypothetical protein